LCRRLPWRPLSFGLSVWGHRVAGRWCLLWLCLSRCCLSSACLFGCSGGLFRWNSLEGVDLLHVPPRCWFPRLQYSAISLWAVGRPPTVSASCRCLRCGGWYRGHGPVMAIVRFARLPECCPGAILTRCASGRPRSAFCRCVHCCGRPRSRCQALLSWSWLLCRRSVGPVLFFPDVF
jgi:hypothetical protein